MWCFLFCGVSCSDIGCWAFEYNYETTYCKLYDWIVSNDLDSTHVDSTQGVPWISCLHNSHP